MRKPHTLTAPLHVGRTLAASPERAWDLLTDTTQWPLWGPSVRAVDSPERYIRQGMRGSVTTAVGLQLPFTITAYETLQYWGWRVAGIAATGHRLSALGKDTCYVEFEVPNYWLPYVIPCKIALRRLANLLEGQPTASLWH